MNLQNISVYILLFLLILLLITTIVFSIIGAIREHEFITDLTSIKLKDGNEFTDTLCELTYCTKDNKDTNCEQINKQHKHLPNILRAILIMHRSQPVPIGKNSYCNKLSSKVYNDVKSRYTFSKLEANQIYENNKMYIDYIYGNHNGRDCMKKFFSLLNPLLKARKRSSHESMMEEEGEKITEFINCYSNLNTNNRKYIDIVLSNLFKPELSNLLSYFY